MSFGSAGDIERRFDRSQSDLVLQASDFSLQGLQEMVDSNIIDLTPKYQRRERWEVERQSELIESFLLNIPVPPIYLAEEEYGVYSIIDGKQRITAVSDFLNGAFALKGLQSFPEITGARFRDLPKTLQNALRIRPYLRVYTLLKQSHPQLKYEVFIRLNRGGIQLNNQEIRNVAFRGDLNDMIYHCAENQHLRTALRIDGPKSAAFKEMLDAEYVLRYLTLQPTWRSYAGSLSKSMDNFMLTHRDASNNEIGRLADKFDFTIAAVNNIWGDHKFQRWDGTRWRQQMLAGLFDAQMIAVGELSEAELMKAGNKQADIINATKDLFDEPEFEEAVRIGTNTPARLRHRVSETVSMIQRNI